MTRTGPLKLGVLVSGQGTNLQAILNASAAGQLDAEVVLVICNHPEVPAIQRARSANVPVKICERQDYRSKEAYHAAIAEKLTRSEVELVVCAGWDRIMRPEFVSRFAGRIINTHPSLLPAFRGGLHAIKDALNYGAKMTGCTIHFVTDELDSGPIISQAAVPVLPLDTEETLAARIHIEEHRLLLQAIDLYSQNRLEVSGRTVKIIDADNVASVAHANYG